MPGQTLWLAEAAYQQSSLYIQPGYQRFPRSPVSGRSRQRLWQERAEGPAGRYPQGQPYRAQLPCLGGRSSQTPPPARRRRHLSLCHYPASCREETHQVQASIKRKGSTRGGTLFSYYDFKSLLPINSLCSEPMQSSCQSHAVG